MRRQRLRRRRNPIGQPQSRITVEPQRACVFHVHEIMRTTHDTTRVCVLIFPLANIMLIRSSQLWHMRMAVGRRAPVWVCWRVICDCLAELLLLFCETSCSIVSQSSEWGCPWLINRVTPVARRRRRRFLGPLCALACVGRKSKS